jgi:hypothetical protein
MGGTSGVLCLSGRMLAYSYCAALRGATSRLCLFIGAIPTELWICLLNIILDLLCHEHKCILMVSMISKCCGDAILRRRDVSKGLLDDLFVNRMSLAACLFHQYHG